MKCQKCAHEFLYWNATNKKQTLMSAEFDCPNCGVRLTMDKRSSNQKLKGSTFMMLPSLIMFFFILLPEDDYFDESITMGALVIIAFSLFYGFRLLTLAKKKSFCVEVKNESGSQPIRVDEK